MIKYSMYELSVSLVQVLKIPLSSFFLKFLCHVCIRLLRTLTVYLYQGMPVTAYISAHMGQYTFPISVLCSNESSATSLSLDKNPVLRLSVCGGNKGSFASYSMTCISQHFVSTLEKVKNSTICKNNQILVE